MAEWIVEAGIGETRAALIEGSAILEARIAVDGALQPGTVLEARLIARFPERGYGIATFDGGEALLTPLPLAVTQGARLLIEITREAIDEPGKPKRARARPSDATVPRPAPGLAELAPPLRAPGDDPLESAGWSQLLEEASTGLVPFPGGALSLTPTPAMTVIDIDGTLAADALAIAGCRAAALAIRRLDIGGGIVIDVPGTDRAARQAAVAAVDAVLPPPFERTAINGFGLLQIVRKRERRSLLELAREDPAGFYARALLRLAEHSRGAGTRTLTAAPAVIARIAAQPGWTAELERRVGAAIGLREDARLAISAGHVAAQFP